MIRKLIQSRLENAGFNVTAVVDAQQAWEKIEEHAAVGMRQFDLLVSDIEMPRMEGLFLTHKLRESRMAWDLPIILFSALITPEDIKKGQAVGANMQISKPCIHQISKYASQVLRERARGVEPSVVPSVAAASQASV